ncbi:MAG: sugar isomerase domain-containing protein [Nitriliruptoraceae bacterium]
MTRPGDDFGEVMRQHLQTAEDTNHAALDEVAAKMMTCIEDGARIHVAGTGHSSGLVLEAFYRAGGLACVNPITHPGLMPLNGGMASTVLERAEDLGEVLLAQASLQPGEVGFIFSSSGVNPVPVAIARGMKAAGMWVVAVSSLPHLRAAPARAGVKLDEIVDVLLDIGVPPGDAAFTLGEMRTAPLSSLTSIYLWNLLLVRLAQLAQDREVALPLWTSANVAGGDERNAELMHRYRPSIGLL